MEATHLTNDQLINFNADMLKANILVMTKWGFSPEHIAKELKCDLKIVYEVMKKELKKELRSKH
jgi:hypothetical protein